MSNRQEIPFKTPWANDAETTIPATPVVGDSYRDESTSDATIGEGWKYGDPVESASENQYNYIQSLISRQLSEQGILSYSDKEDYSASVGAIVMDNGAPYLCLQDNGPASAVKQPSTEPLYWFNFASNQYASNKIKTSQLVVVGADGNPLPSAVPTNYAIGEEVALGWKAATAVTNLITDANGNVKLQTPATDTGTIYYDIDLADNNTPTLSKLFGSIMRCINVATGEYVQVFSEQSTGITVSNPTATTARLAIDLTDLVDGFKIGGFSDFRGRLEVLSVDDVERAARGGYLLITNVRGSARIYPDGTIMQLIPPTVIGSGIGVRTAITYPIPFTTGLTLSHQAQGYDTAPSTVGSVNVSADIADREDLNILYVIGIGSSTTKIVSATVWGYPNA